MTEQACIGQSCCLVVKLEGVSVSQVALRLLQVTLPQVEAGLVSEHLSVTLVDLDLLLEVSFGLHGVIVQELLFKGEAGVTLSCSLANMLLNDVVAFALTLVLRDGDVLVELVLLTFDHLTDSAAHLLHKEDVKLRVEPILVVLVQAFE